MNKKIFGLLSTVLVVSLMLIPLALAKPGAEKKNEKFEYFTLVVSGETDGIFDRYWYTPPNADIMDNKTIHGRNAGWTTGPIVELTVGDITYTTTTSPVRVTYDTSYDFDTIRDNDGIIQVVHVRLTDVVTVYVNDMEIGTLILRIKAIGTIGDTGFAYTGNIIGYGTGDLSDVHISAVDIVDPTIPFFGRMGTITGFPDLPPLV